MNNIDDKKTTLLRLFTLLISFGSIAIFFGIYSLAHPSQDQASAAYLQNLNKYLE